MGVIIIELVVIIAGELEGASFKQAPQPSALAEREVSPVVPLPEARAVANEDMTLPPTDAVSAQFVVVKDSCGPHFDGECVRVRSGPGTEYPVISSVRNNMVLKVGGTVEVEGQTWYKIVFDEWLRYPERIENDWYIAAEFLEGQLFKSRAKCVFRLAFPVECPGIVIQGFPARCHEHAIAVA